MSTSAFITSPEHSHAALLIPHVSHRLNPINRTALSPRATLHSPGPGEPPARQPRRLEPRTASVPSLVSPPTSTPPPIDPRTWALEPPFAISLSNPDPSFLVLSNRLLPVFSATVHAHYIALSLSIRDQITKKPFHPTCIPPQPTPSSSPPGVFHPHAWRGASDALPFPFL
ncbi:hypothetical protein HETIRDRAFT_460210 [Heterobasidion irregulare TC 32-1]|uniref:Uncharacterized protein n=1 Tax=Heterobasidion irregulare (strain TC 32-1) TaxID=747525 RepID=W4JXU2_HETIT|nr:uncharacterized protein HETIRDRAFT_460210 [Heterobasidion irregulare TC 32-1]ETW77706.1 hypothetical protein HETIRDRAFT_460210 [Heterobasidion irregulare TC 32-1]